MKQRRFNQYLDWFAFFQTSSFLMIFGINLSFFLFGNLFLHTAWKRLGKLLRPKGWLEVMIMLFMLGAILSTVSNIWEGHESAFLNSLRVLPNYIYWSLLLLMFTSFENDYYVDYQSLFRAVTIGIIVVLVYYVFFQDLIANENFFKRFGPNNFSLLLICYTPYAVYYVRQRIHPAAAIITLAVLLLLQLSEGRRAGVGLVLIGGMAAFLVPMLRLRSATHVVRLFAIVFVALAVASSSLFEGFVRDQSSRVHQLVYASSSDYLSADRSYLTRLAMIEKGLALFRENMTFGVGLNNFTAVNASIEGDFEGAEYVIDKDIFGNFSSHNSYINILAEGGLALAIPFGAIFFILLFNGLRRFKAISDPEKVIVISFITMSVHIFFTNGVVNSLVWFEIGLLAYVVSRRRRKRLRTGLRVARP